MAVVSISMPERLLDDLDEFIETHGYSGRSEAVRDGARELLYEFEDTPADREVVCVVTAVFEHDSGAETNLSELRHGHEALVTSNIHSHAGEACLELFVLEGAMDAVGSYVTRLRTVDGVDAVEYSIFSAAQRTSVET